MITRDNLKDLLHGLSDKAKDSISNTDKEYIRLDLSVFNTGSVCTMELMDDLPIDLDDLIDTGNTAFLEVAEVQGILERV